MRNVKLNICGTKNLQFTTKQMAKVQKGIEIFEKVVNSDTFKDQICNYTWTAANGTCYNRFHLSNGMSNEQVWNCLTNGTACWNTQIETATVNILPCANRSQMLSNIMNPSLCVSTNVGRTMAANTTTTTPTICLNTNCLNDANYTAVHIAAALVHECCVNIGFTCHNNGTLVPNVKNTVPVACAITLIKCCKTVCAEDTNVVSCCNAINTDTCDYCACTTMFHIPGTETVLTTACTHLDAVVGCLETELDCLTNLDTKNNDELNRLTTITNCLTTLTELKSNLQATSLDACDTVGTPVCTKTTAGMPQVA